MFKEGNYCTVWAVSVDDNKVNVELSTSRKNKNTGEYETDFSSKFVRFVGDASVAAQKLSRGDRIKLGECGVSTYWNKETGRSYTNFIVFDFEALGKSNSAKADNDDELPM